MKKVAKPFKYGHSRPFRFFASCHNIVFAFDFTIDNIASGTKYLTATGPYGNGATFSTELDFLDGAQLWCIEYLTDYDAVNIVSMGMRYAGGKKPYVVYNSPSVTGLGVQNYTATYKQYEPIRSSGNAYYFKNEIE